MAKLTVPVVINGLDVAKEMIKRTMEQIEFEADVIPHIENGLFELTEHPKKYKKYEAPNGWGTVESTRRFFENILKAWRDFKRWEDKDIVEVTTFWIT